MSAPMSLAQTITVSTVSRAPFSFETPDGDQGFSIDLMKIVGEKLGREVVFSRYDEFNDMLNAVEAETVDAAIANISITAERERRMDFSQPMFESGIQVMVPFEGVHHSILSLLFNLQLWGWIGATLLFLFCSGMLMWRFERKAQPFFDLKAKDASFPAFWWALNLTLNGGFEERMPRSRPGRFLGVVLVIGSLFFVSVVVGQITAFITVEAISTNVDNLNDLDGKRVATTSNSTSAAFLEARQIRYSAYPSLDELLEAFENERVEAVVFDGPVLSYYATNQGYGEARVLERVYRIENYGIAFPTNSELREDVDQALLELREDGTFAQLTTKWFGPSFRN
ncbi:MAG: transporter substrate-binding domain-containing protein [Sulfitobacter sp.]